MKNLIQDHHHANQAIKASIIFNNVSRTLKITPKTSGTGFINKKITLKSIKTMAMMNNNTPIEEIIEEININPPINVNVANKPKIKLRFLENLVESLDCRFFDSNDLHTESSSNLFKGNDINLFGHFDTFNNFLSLNLENSFPFEF